MTLKVIRRLQAFSNAIRRTFVQHFTQFQLTMCLHGPTALAELLVSRCILSEQWHFLPALQDSLFPAGLFIPLGTSVIEPQIRHMLTLCTFINFIYLLTYSRCVILSRLMFTFSIIYGTSLCALVSHVNCAYSHGYMCTGATCRSSDLQFTGCRFESWLDTPHSGLGQATYTHVPLSPSSIIWYTR